MLVGDHDFNTAIVDHVVHRPWKMPNRPWVMTQTWHDVLFAHWPVDAVTLRGKVPRTFELDLFDGKAWIGIVPFHMTNVAPRGVPALPWVSKFPELNVRTYVRVDDRPGVYFFSLDAGSTFAVKMARAFLNLPYHSATMNVAHTTRGIEYRSSRDSNPAVEFTGIYGPTESVFVAAEGSLEYFLTERYCLYNIDHRGAPYRLQIHHPPWRLQAAVAEIARNTLAGMSGLTLAKSPALLHYANRQDAIAWTPERLGGQARGG